MSIHKYIINMSTNLSIPSPSIKPNYKHFPCNPTQQKLIRHLYYTQVFYTGTWLVNLKNSSVPVFSMKSHVYDYYSWQFGVTVQPMLVWYRKEHLYIFLPGKAAALTDTTWCFHNIITLPQYCHLFCALDRVLTSQRQLATIIQPANPVNRNPTLQTNVISSIARANIAHRQLALWFWRPVCGDSCQRCCQNNKITTFTRSGMNGQSSTLTRSARVLTLRS